MSVDRWPYKLRAIALLLLGRTRAAEAVFTEMLQRWPGDAYALASRSHTRSQMGCTAQALDDALALVTLNPNAGAADWFNAGFLLDKQGRNAEAEGAFRRAVAIDPQLDRAWYGLGIVLIRQGRCDEAVAALKRNTELQPMSPYGWYQLARMHAQQHQPDQARRIIAHLKGFEPSVAAQLERETGLAG
jgi:tetratricopeptide (TPR) repeat protein